MATKPTDWQDQWIAEHYPKAVFSVEEYSGEVVVSLGENEDGEETS
jgi:hypothetical protein